MTTHYHCLCNVQRQMRYFTNSVMKCVYQDLEIALRKHHNNKKIRLHKCHS